MNPGGRGWGRGEGSYRGVGWRVPRSEIKHPSSRYVMIEFSSPDLQRSARYTCKLGVTTPKASPSLHPTPTPAAWPGSCSVDK